MKPLRFYFDFTSTFSYIAVMQLDALAARHGRTVDWRAVSLGHLFQAQGITPPPSIPAKFQYLGVDFVRSCARAGLPCKIPVPFPPDVKLARLLFWRIKARDENLSHAYARAVMSTLFGRGEPVATVEQLTAVCAPLGVPADDVAAAGTDSVAKAAVIATVEDAKADGVIGAPFVICDGEPFWGADRLDVLAERLAASRA